MRKNIATTAAFNWNLEIPISSHTVNLFSKIQNQTKEIKLLALDWQSVTSEGFGHFYDPLRKTDFVQDIKENIDLVHIFYLGNVLGKWNKFNSFLDTLIKKNVETINPPELIKYMINKDYMIDLQNELPIIKTKKVSSTLSLEELHSVCGSEYQVVKPLNGECGTLVHKIEELNSDLWNKYKNVCEYVLIQPFMKEIYDGENAMIFMGKKFFHALKKNNDAKEFKINISTGKSSYQSISVSEEEIQMGFQVQKYFESVQNMRIDYLITDKGPIIMEIEAVNPSHYYEDLHIEPAQIDRMSEFYKKYKLNR